MHQILETQHFLTKKNLKNNFSKKGTQRLAKPLLPLGPFLWRRWKCSYCERFSAMSYVWDISCCFHFSSHSSNTLETLRIGRRKRLMTHRRSGGCPFVGQINILSLAGWSAQMTSKSHVTPWLAGMAASDAEMQLYVCARSRRRAWWTTSEPHDAWRPVL